MLDKDGRADVHDLAATQNWKMRGGIPGASANLLAHPDPIVKAWNQRRVTRM